MQEKVIASNLVYDMVGKHGTNPSEITGTEHEERIIMGSEKGKSGKGLEGQGGKKKWNESSGGARQMGHFNGNSISPLIPQTSLMLTVKFIFKSHEQLQARPVCFSYCEISTESTQYFIAF